MADLIGGGAAASNGNASTPSRRPTGAPNPTSSPSGIRGPRMIMQERAAREAARQKAEQEQMQLERQRAEQEARLLEETQRRNAERRAAAAAATGAAGGGSGGAASVPQPDPTSQRRPVATDTPQSRPVAGGTSRQPATTQPQTRHTRTTSGSHVGQQPYSTNPQPGTTQQPATATQGGQETTVAGSRPRNSFPHAFERWETLSAHWEGLTSFWIRRLEQNNQDIDRDPVNQALSRQVTDLTAAGANLFHAVVELQRLRASSERKFQRWFFETRAELERSQEVNAMLERALEDERRARENAVQAAIQKERVTSANDERVKEMKKELQISKEEARRAWEELGRREHEERERTQSLQSGQPTIVGGVQVVPMTQGVPSRHGSSREQRGYQTDYSGQQSGYTGEYSQSPANPPVTSSPGGNFYPSGDAGQEGVSYTGAGSEGGYSEGEYTIDAQGQFVRDSQGNKVPFIAPPSPVSDEGLEEYETPATNPPSAGYSQTPTTTAGGQQQGTQDYSGSGYAAPGWETVPRHHHPTRLSDVMEEEDERSRASNSQVGRH